MEWAYLLHIRNRDMYFVLFIPFLGAKWPIIPSVCQSKFVRDEVFVALVMVDPDPPMLVASSDGKIFRG